jgi:putative transposase
VVFIDGDIVDLVLRQILRAGTEKRFVVLAYCFMPDHLHLIVGGAADDSDCKSYIKAAKQYSAYSYKKQRRHRLQWCEYSDAVVLG